MRPKALIFYTYLPPWRIDVFNEMASYYDLTIVFLFKNPVGMEYDQKLLSNKLHMHHFFHEKGFNIGSRQFRTGIFKIVKKYKPQIIFSHEYSPTSIILSILLKLKLVDFKYIITTSDNLKMAENTGTYRKAARHFVLGQANGLVVYSSKVKDWYVNHFKHLQIEICPNIQNPESLLAHESAINQIVPKYISQYHLINDKIALYVGRLAPEKGLDLLIGAFSKASNSDYKLVLVGEGSIKEELQNQALELGISEKVVFPGRFDGVELYAWYRMANFFVLPSRYEPFGAVVNEALIYGLPVLASKYIGALDYIDEDSNGIVFDPLKNDDFLVSLKKAMNQYSQRKMNPKNLMCHDFHEYVKVFSEFK